MIPRRSLALVGRAIGFILLVVCVDAMAMWARMSESELLERSDLVVSGTLIGSSAVRIGGEDLLLGAIKIDTVYKGGASLSIAYLVLPSADRPVSSSDLHYQIGQSGLWFLRQRSADERGLFLADHPQRFTPSATAAGQIEALQKILPK